MTKVYPLDVIVLRDDEGKSLLSKGFHADAPFLGACERAIGEGVSGWGKIKREWQRFVPNPEGGVQLIPAREGARGAFPTTWICDYDWEASDA